MLIRLFYRKCVPNNTFVNFFDFIHSVLKYRTSRLAFSKNSIVLRGLGLRNLCFVGRQKQQLFESLNTMFILKWSCTADKRFKFALKVKFNMTFAKLCQKINYESDPSKTNSYALAYIHSWAHCLWQDDIKETEELGLLFNRQISVSSNYDNQ